MKLIRAFFKISSIGIVKNDLLVFEYRSIKLISFVKRAGSLFIKCNIS
jgi:hypothetical protein